MKKQTETKKTLTIKTSIKAGFTPQPEPPGIVDPNGTIFDGLADQLLQNVRAR